MLSVICMHNIKLSIKRHCLHCQVSVATHDRDHADKTLEEYVTTTVMDVLMMFFNSPFSDQSTTIQVFANYCILVFRHSSSLTTKLYKSNSQCCLLASKVLS